jgi:hypothetical protein
MNGFVRGVRLPLRNSPNSRMLRSFRTRFPRRCGKSSNALLVILAIAAAVLGYHWLANRCDQELHAAVTRELNTLLPEARVYVGHVVQKSSGDVIVSDLRMISRDDPSKEVIFSAQRMLLKGKLTIADWLQKQTRVEQIDMYGVQCEAWPDASGRWSLSAITPEPKPNSLPPRIVFHDCSLRLRKSESEDAPSTTFHNLNGTFECQHQTKNASLPKLYIATLTGRSSGTLDSFNARATVNPDAGHWRVDGGFKALRFNRDLQNRLPETITPFVKPLAGLECTATAAFHVTDDGSGETPSFHITGNIASGRVQDGRFPYTLEGIASEFSCKNDQLQLRKMTAISGSAAIKLETDIYGLGKPNPRMTVNASFTDLQLDERLRRSLPASLQIQWDKFRLAGAVDGRAWLLFDGQTWTPELDVQCKQVAIRPWIFPYPIESIAGRVTYKNKKINAQSLTGTAGGQPIQGSFSLTKGSSQLPDDSAWYGSLECSASGPVSIDSQLIQCLTQRDEPTTGAEKFVQSLHPAGLIQLTYARFQRSGPEKPWRKSINAHIYSGQIQYDDFRYPIYNITGNLVCNDKLWQLNQFEGRNDSGRIRCSGTWRTDDPSIPFDLSFEARDVPMEEELKRALPKSTQFIWDEIRPQGSTDLVTVRLLRRKQNSKVETYVDLRESSLTNQLEGSSLRLKPRAFPYLLTDCDCSIRYTPGQVEILKASGINGNTKIAFKGRCQPKPDGRWHADIEWLPQTRLTVDKELLNAVPKSIRESLVKTAFQGPVSVLGKSGLTFANSRDGNLESTWDCQFAIEDGKLGDGKSIGSLRGTVWMQGASDGVNMRATGSVGVDALTVMGVPVTRLNGPFALLGSNLYFGSSVYEVLPQMNNQGPTEMTANALSGKIVLSGYGLLNDVDRGEFHVNSTLTSADLNLLLKDLGVASASAIATCDASLEFHGIPWNPHTYDGGGEIRLTNAELYELPFMIRLLNIASVSAEDSAFQSATIQFNLDGNNIPLRVSCDGEVLRLYGEGSTNLRREIDLQLYAYAGSRNPLRRAVEPFLPDSKLSTVLRIQVDGTMNNPVMTPTAFPQVEETLQQMFPEVAESSAYQNNPARIWRK